MLENKFREEKRNLILRCQLEKITCYLQLRLYYKLIFARRVKQPTSPHPKPNISQEITEAGTSPSTVKCSSNEGQAAQLALTTTASSGLSARKATPGRTAQGGPKSRDVCGGRCLHTSAPLPVQSSAAKDAAGGGGKRPAFVA